MKASYYSEWEGTYRVIKRFLYTFWFNGTNCQMEVFIVTSKSSENQLLLANYFKKIVFLVWYNLMK